MIQCSYIKVAGGALIEINSIAYATVPGGTTLDITVENSAGTPVGVIAGDYIIGDNVISINGTVVLYAPAETAFDIDVFDSAGSPIGTLNMSDEFIISDTVDTLNGVAITGAKAEGGKTIVVQTDDTVPVQVGTALTDTDTSLIIEVPGGSGGGPCSDATQVIKDSAGSTLYTNNIASGASEDQIITDATITNSDGSFNGTVEAEGNEVLPDITHTQTDGSFEVLPAQTPLVCNAGADATQVIKDSGSNILYTNNIAGGTSEDQLIIDSTIENSDASFNDTVIAEGTKVLPDVTITLNGGGTIKTSPSVIDIDIEVEDDAGTTGVGTVVGNKIIVPAGGGGVPTLNTSNLRLTGITTSARIGDDGDLQKGRGVDWFNLSFVNPWGHSFRFCGNTGGYTDGTSYFDVAGAATTYTLAFPGDEMCDWAYYNHVNLTVSMWYLVSQGTTVPSPVLDRGGKVGGKSANVAVDECVASTQNGYTDWYLPNIMEQLSLNDWSQATNESLNYKPINYSPTGRTPSVANWRLLSGSFRGTVCAYYVIEYGGVANFSVTTTTKTYFMKRVALLSDMGL